MIEHDEENYDFEGHSFSETAKRSSTCYEPEDSDLRNILLVEEYLNEDKYKNQHSVKIHIDYLEGLLNKLQNARKQEFSICPTNIELDGEITRVGSLLKRLGNKALEKA
jgi:hypothetical protein